MSRIILSLSGGMDSATLLGVALSEGNDVSAVGFTYGSKHNPYENKASQALAGFYHVPYELLDLSGVMAAFKSDLLRTGGEIPEGHYEEESMSRTVVPGRNLIFISVLAGVAWSKEATEVWVGIHSGDHAIYPDCRPAFYYSMDTALRRGTDERVVLKAPFLHENKTSIIKMGHAIGVPYQLTRTCYKDQPIACGKCGSCQERLEAFKANGVEDPVEYESRVILPRT